MRHCQNIEYIPVDLLWSRRHGVALCIRSVPLNPWLVGPQHTAMLPVETFEMRKSRNTTPSKAKKKAKEIFKTYKLFTYGEIHYITN
jgi:hypothetical protein